AYESYEEMLADERIDAVCICTPSGFHAEQAKKALLAGKHAAVEKPIAMTPSDADAVIETAQKTGKLLTVISQLRFAPDIIRLKEAVRDERFGKIHFCNLYMKFWREETYYSGSRWKGSRMLDGGVLMNQGIHGIDLLRHIMGGAKVIGSVTDRLYHKIEAPDTALALLRYDCGALGTVEATTAAYPGFDLKLEIIGEKGYALVEEDRLTSLVIEGKDQPLTPEAKSSGTASDPKAVGWKKHALQLRNFTEAIGGTSPLALCGEDGKAAVALISDIYQETL
ncbi:MAG: Gfo/Idh/MocA family oxidoreductase, partial [Clostridia bacterium]|nr:Gfo/Idh/MocA family oxidoreductase [Clostridia bacterium]